MYVDFSPNCVTILDMGGPDGNQTPNSGSIDDTMDQVTGPPLFCTTDQSHEGGLYTASV